MKLLSRRKPLLYPAKTKIDNYTKILSLFKYCFSYKLKCHSKNPAFPRNRLIFFSNQFLNKHSILLGCIKYISTYLLTTNTDTKKSKT